MPSDLINPAAMNANELVQPASAGAALQLRDIHLPEPISWWPIAPGWWLLLAAIILLIVISIVSIKVYRSRQLQRDVNAELERIESAYNKTLNKSRLAKDLSILLRRASISLYPKTDIAGLVGDDWLNFLDVSNKRASSGRKFNSDTGRILLTAPYLPDDAEPDFEAAALIRLCESWLHSSHAKALPETYTTHIDPASAHPGSAQSGTAQS